ncbi:sporulation protein Cse60 [uncultured Clostridium sp.]|uniref:sporulation protein Cse60 n=1 Tax=uncultured Clostridium sp. TaxID=59620 RepID=UPI002611C991|nr:sporulation protein Cse60 [uncultured Clostridium sp.]
MYKVKFIRELSTKELENSINKFLGEQPKDFNLIDLKYLYNDGKIKMFTTLIIYSI